MATDQETTVVPATGQMVAPMMVVPITAMLKTIRMTVGPEVVPMAISPMEPVAVLVNKENRRLVILTVRHPMILDPEATSRQEMDPTVRTGISPVEASQPLQVAMMVTVRQEVEDRLISVHSLMRMIMIR